MTYVRLLLLAVTAAAGVQPLQAGWFDFDKGCCKPAGCCDSAACQPCTLVCHPEIKTETVKNYCWEVECDYVCVPKVQCPISKWVRNKLHGEPCSNSCGSADCQSCGTSCQSCGTSCQSCGTSCQSCGTSCQSCDSCSTTACGVCDSDSCEQPPLRARIRRVRRLKKVDYECEKCVVEWHIQQCAPCVGGAYSKGACTTAPASTCTPTMQ